LGKWNDSDGGSWSSLSLDKHVEYRDGYSKKFQTTVSFLPITCARNIGNKYIEIDLDETKCREMNYVFGGNVIREVPWEVVTSRNMINASSVSSEAVTITQDGINRINRGELSEFEYKMVDNSGNRHHWTYKK